MLPSPDDESPPSRKGGSEKQMILPEFLLEETGPLLQLQTLPAVINHAHVYRLILKQGQDRAVRYLSKQDTDNQLTSTANEIPLQPPFDHDDPPPPYTESTPEGNAAQSQRNNL
jgi:hypothetical protein